MLTHFKEAYISLFKNLCGILFYFSLIPLTNYEMGENNGSTAISESSDDQEMQCFFQSCRGFRK